jgi:hypothetical protein
MQEKLGFMGRSLRLAVLVLRLGAAALGARAQEQPAAPPVPVTPAAQPPPASAGSAAPSLIPATKPQAPWRRARRVITNDDIDGIGSIYKGGLAPDLTYINDCDRACFEAVRVAARIYPNGLQWKKDLLDAIERVKGDGPWQGLLGDFAEVRGKFCLLEQQRNDELARASDPRNVTPVEISIEEKYDRLFKVAQADLLSLYDRAQVLRQSPASSGLEIAFMNFQTNRIVTASCYVAPQYRPNWEGNDDP